MLLAIRRKYVVSENLATSVAVSVISGELPCLSVLIEIAKLWVVMIKYAPALDFNFSSIHLFSAVCFAATTACLDEVALVVFYLSLIET